ncbi:sulfate transporter family protein [Methylobacterium currus]|uniref:Sulfate transporter family protein n=1 Tax=Methylobacterium currus TaxID=2051553 RepID=A0A2R4WNP6_9HYPH|nr:sulfate transporter family protein [Methylobacterium currus]AWB23138.1 sulfate transporter family protein [Methylobacterium currus]
MLINAAFAALRQVFSRPLRAILWKSLGLTVGLLALVWFALTKGIAALLVAHPISTDYAMVNAVASFLAGAGLFVGLAYILPPVSILVAGYFLDDAAAIVERTDFPDEVPGQAMPLGRAMLYTIRFAALALAVNLAALALLLVPGINVAAFFLANTYLLGREYFELAAARFRPLSEAGAMRRTHTATVMLAGALLAGLMLVPIVNLITPLFGIALMVHVHKGLSRDRLLKAPSTRPPVAMDRDRLGAGPR